MNVLFAIPYVPTPIRVRSYSFLRTLQQRGHHMILATVADARSESDQKALSDWTASGVEVISLPLTKLQKVRNGVSALARNVPVQTRFSHLPALNAALQQRVGDAGAPAIDVAHVEHLRGAQLGLALHNQLPTLWDSVDCITRLFEQAAVSSRSLFGRLMSRMELGRTRRYEGWLAAQFPHVTATAENDVASLRKLAAPFNPRGQFSVLPNGVDLNYFAPQGNGSGPERAHNTIVFSGKMSYHANVTAALFLAEKVMPLIWAKRPNVELVIAGSAPTAAIQRLASTSNESKRITVTGFLPDLRVPLRAATVAVAPLLYGTGIQNKVIEALACGTPVVASAQAVSALPNIIDGQDILVASTADEIARQTERVLDDAALRAQLSAAGRRYVERYHDWGSVVAQLEDTYQRTIEESAHVRTIKIHRSTTNTNVQADWLRA